MMHVFEYKKIKRRKPVECFGCTKQIKPGDTAYRNEVIYDNRHGRSYFCTGCNEEIQELPGGTEIEYAMFQD